MSKKAAHKIVPFNQINNSCISFTDLADNDRVPSQKIGYVRYKDSSGDLQFDIQTPKLLLDNGGIPDSNGPYYTTNKQRAFLKLPLDPNSEVELKEETAEEKEKRLAELAEFKDALKRLDKFIISQQKNIFGKNEKKYTYQPIVREAQVVEDDSDSDSDNGETTPPVKRPDYMKCKIPLEWETENVQVELYRKNKKGTEEYESDGSRTKIEVSTLDDLRKHVAYMRKGRYVMHVSKIWAMKQPANGQSTRMYGVTLKLLRAEVPQYVPSVVETTGTNAPFVDSDDEEEDHKEVQHFIENSKVESSSSSDDSDNESSEETVQLKATGKTKGGKAKGKDK